MPVAHPDGSVPAHQLLRASASRLLAEAVSLELRHFLESMAQAGGGRARDPIVLNGLHPERIVVTGIGPVAVRLPKVRRRDGTAARFRSVLVPPYARRACPLDPGAQSIYLRAMAKRDAGLALQALFGRVPQALPLEVLRALQRWWQAQCVQWSATGAGTAIAHGGRESAEARAS